MDSTSLTPWDLLDAEYRDALEGMPIDDAWTGPVTQIAGVYLRRTGEDGWMMAHPVGSNLEGMLGMLLRIPVQGIYDDREKHRQRWAEVLENEREAGRGRVSAERERCAKIAEDFHASATETTCLNCHSEIAVLDIDAPREIAAAIRRD